MKKDYIVKIRMENKLYAKLDKEADKFKNEKLGPKCVYLGNILEKEVKKLK